MRHMRVRAAGLTAGLMSSMAAALFVLLAPAPARAGDPMGDTNYCYYANEPYSPGACIRSVCTSPDSQKCNDNGTWGPCSGC
jgi:hypothetical protein